MTVAVLVAGTLFRAPEQRTSGSGRRYVRATLKVAAADNGTAEFWDLLVFSETAATELQRLEIGERLAVQGGLKTELYAPENKPARISRTVFVDHVMVLRAPPKQRKPKAAAPEQSRQAGPERVSIIPPAEGSADLDNDIPF